MESTRSMMRIGVFVLAMAAPFAYAASNEPSADEQKGAPEQASPADTQKSGDSEKGSFAQSVSDATATASIKTRLAMSKDTNAKDIHVTTTDGTVSLEGDVATAEEKEKAAEIARNTNGVTEVQNKLHVAGPAEKSDSKENQG